ncbi:MAG TPA: hypothetical protein VK485_07405 [Sphingomicrobium sp.]|nr:hypothetical protein [Sphingomicrobium sp.]
MRYPGYLRLIDSFGLLAIASTVTFATLPEPLRPAEHLDDLWGNLSSELVGIWLAVRLIDFVIKKNEGATKGRVRVVRGMRYLERLFTSFYRYPRSHELADLLREFRWNKGRLEQRKKHLKRDEVGDAELFYDIGAQLLYLLPQVAPNDQDKIEYDSRRYHGLLTDLGIAREKAEQNILEETDEDSGI